MRKLLTAERMIVGEETLLEPWILLEDETIAALGSRRDSEAPPHDAAESFPGATLAPAFLDIHVHGGGGHDVMEASPVALDRVSRFVASRGVGAYLPTTVTADVEVTLRALDVLAGAIQRGGGEGSAVPLGIHLEGPFISPAKRGVHAPELIQPPSPALFERFWEAARGGIRLMTVAPEMPGALALIEQATARGVTISLGHSNATAAEARAGIAAGGRSATHTFNAMRAIDHREPGLAITVLDSPELYAEIICDGVHVEPAMVRLFARTKRADRTILITDGISATGMPDGKYHLGELEVDVHGGRCLYNGLLAGSVLTMDRAVQNYAAFTGRPLVDSIRSASSNPAALLGFADHWGSLRAGGPANLNVLRPDGELCTTFLNGERVAFAQAV